MKRYLRSHLSNDALHHSALTHAGVERGSTADLLADLAEIDVRRFYLAMAYPSLFAYCVAELRLSEDAAYKRIKAARAARRFPVLFEAVADARLNVSGVVLLAPHLTEATAPDLLSAAQNKSRFEIEKLLAERFPRPDVPGLVAPIPSTCATPSACATGCADATGPAASHGSPAQAVGPVPMLLAAGAAGSQQAPGPVDWEIRSRVKPLAPQRYEVHFSMSQSGYDKLRHAQELLGHQIPAGDIAAVFERALDALIPQLEKSRFAATASPRRSGHPSRNPRHIPAQVKREVWERDGGRCTFESESGRRCPARTGLEFDHVLEVARGGDATVAGVRLLCRAHNQHGAERTFGSEFMRHKRIAAAEARAAAKERAAAPARKASAAELARGQGSRMPTPGPMSQPSP